MRENMKATSTWQRRLRWMASLTFLVGVIGAGGVWAQVQTFTPPTESDVEYYHTDAIGSVRLVTNQAGQVTRRQDFTPFGTPISDIPTFAQPRGFAGMERDEQTGFDYFGARYLLADVSRFTTVDPGHVNGNILDPQSWNGYAYARNNPLKYVDPTGTEYRLCGLDAEGRTSTCGRVSDQYFAILERSPGGRLQVSDGAIWQGDQRVGYYTQVSVDPTFADFVRLTGEQSGRWLGEQSKEMAIGAAIAATGGLASGIFGGGLAATGALGLEVPTMTEIANVTAKGATMANISVKLTAGEFQANLMKSGYKVVSQGVGKNGPFRVLSNGQSKYSIYIASSTGEATAQLQVGRWVVSKIRLSGF